MAKYNKTATRRAFYKQMFTQLDGRCMICGEQERLVIDHNHATDDMRGLLCYSHNAGLGMFQDNPDLLDKAANYLRTQGYENTKTTIKAEPVSYKIKPDQIIELLVNNPNKSQRAISLIYMKLVNVTYECAQSRVTRTAKKYGIPKYIPKPKKQP